MEVKDKKRLKKRLKIGGILVLVFALLYIPSLVFWIYGDDVATEIVRMGEIEELITTDAYIIRSEEVLKSEMDGECLREVTEGEKVQANARIATVLNQDSANLLKELKNLDNRIIDAQESNKGVKAVFSEDIKKIEKDIDERLKHIANCINKNNYSEIKKTKTQIDDLMEKKARISGELSPSDTFLKSLLAQKEVLQKRIESTTSYIVSLNSGIISYEVDGYEGLLSPEKIPELTIKDIQNIKVKSSVQESDSLKVEKEKPFAKVVSGIEYYFAFVLGSKNKMGFEVDDRVSIRINNLDRIIEGIVYYKSNEMDGKYIYAVKCDKALGETVSMRSVNIDIIKNQYSGLKVRLSSLTNVDKKNSTAKIVLVRSGFAKYVKVKIVGKNDTYAIVDNPDVTFGGVSLYSSYVINPKNIEEGQMIN